MSLPEDPIIPTDPPPPRTREEIAAQRAKRRRATRREMIPTDAAGQAELIATLARRAYPSIELFIFSLTCGAIMGLGFLLDSQAVLLLGILVSPLMVPWVGFLLSILTGSPRFFFETFMGLLVSAALVFIGGLLAGFAARMFLPMTLTNVFIHARLWIPELAVIAIGAVTLVISFARSETRPFLPSVIIAYAFLLPISAGGFGLGSGVPGIWPQGMLVFLAHFALASVLGLITLFALKLRPSTGGMLFSGAAFLLFVIILAILMGSRFPSASETVVQSTPTNQAIVVSSLPPPTSGLVVTSTSSPTPVINTATVTPTLESTATKVEITQTIAAALTQVALTPSITSVAIVSTPTSIPAILPPTAESVPVVGKISAIEGGGANLRQTPNGKYLLTLDNGALVEVLPDFKQVNGVTWIHVFVTRNGQRIEGWVLESVVIYATPAPNFEPSSTPAP